MGTVDDCELHESVSVACQLRTLAELARRVGEAVARGMRPVVEIDLDLCALRPVFRTKAALRQVGEEFSIPEFIAPDTLPLLPGYSDEAWLAFVQRLDLPARYPALRWIESGRASRSAGTPFARFHSLYWTTEWLREDEPTAGLGAFVNSVEASGGHVVFLSGRWLEAQVEPSLESLRRAGIARPRLLIGNPWHETLVAPGQATLSDAAVKAWRQATIVREMGTPIAVIDDRAANREAIVSSHSHPVASVAIAIPGFTADPVVLDAPLRLSTFEDFSRTIDSPPLRSRMSRRYPGLGQGWPGRGDYAGLGRNGLEYVLPRLAPTARPRPSLAPFEGLLEQHRERRAAGQPLSERELLDAAERTIPESERATMRQTLLAARELAERNLAAPWPASTADQQSLWYSLVCAWLHSRDVEVMMDSIGYRVEAAGVHDLREWVDAREVRGLILAENVAAQERIRRANYSDWIVNWARSLPEGPVNVSFLNPSLLVDLCQWSPRQTKPQDAMDVHRLADHHEGDGGERFDPIEAGINNLLHQREGRDGVRKEPVVPWATLAEQASTESGAVELAKNSAARQALRDAIARAVELEQAGCLTPWSLCEPR